MKKLTIGLLSLLSSVSHATNFSYEDVQAMHQSGVQVELTGETSSQVVPAELPPAKLRDATVLNFNGAQIYTFPDWLFKFPNLARLDLHNAGLPMTEVMKLKALPNLEVLDLSGNPIFSNPSSSDNLTALWQALPNLHLLNISNIGASSAQIGDLSALISLVELDLSHNKLTKVAPLKLTALKGLHKLNLGFNQIQDFNPSMISMASIQVLDLKHNLLSKLPFSGDMPQLGTLNVSENSNTDRDNGLVIDETYGGIFVVLWDFAW